MNRRDVCVFVRSEEDFNRIVGLIETYGERFESGMEYDPTTENDHFYYGVDGWSYYNGVYGQAPSEDEIPIDELEELLKGKAIRLNEKAKELVEFFLPLVYCYSGSGMLTNTEDESVMLENAKKCALKVVDEILSTDCRDMGEEEFEEHIREHEQLKLEIEKYGI